MQTYNVINNELTGAELPGKIYENLQSLKSDFSGTSFPTENLVAGMSCFRTDQNKIYKLLSDLATWRLVSDLNVEGGASIATQAEAEEGTNNTKVMTPLRVKDVVKTFRFSLGATGNTAIYTAFARVSNNNESGNTSGTCIISEAGNYGSVVQGTYLVTVSGRGKVPTMDVVEITKPSQTTPIFGYWQDGAYFYFGVYVTSYRGSTNITVLGTSNVLFKNFGDASTIEGWTVVTPKQLATISDIPVIATQVEAESGTDNSKVMTPKGVEYRLDKDRKVKTYSSLADLGLPDTATIAEICSALPNQSELSFYGRTSVHTGLDLPIGGSVRIENRSTSGYSAYNLYSYSQTNGRLFYGSYSTYNNVGFSGWREIFTDVPLNIWQRNNYYRGKSLGTSLTTAQSNAIRNGTFDDIYVGDYWTIGGVVYRIVAIDYYYNCGDAACTTHHVVVVPDTILYSAQMNTSNVVTGGYVGSAMYTSNLASAKTTILNAFGSGHILTIRQYFSNAASSYVTGGTWADANVWLMNEINVYGCSVFANLVHGTNWIAAYTIDNCRYPAFRANPRLIHTRQTYWLRDVAASTTFALVYYDGLAHYYNASNSYGVRPAFCVY